MNLKKPYINETDHARVFWHASESWWLRSQAQTLDLISWREGCYCVIVSASLVFVNHASLAGKTNEFVWGEHYSRSKHIVPSFVI